MFDFVEKNIILMNFLFVYQKDSHEGRLIVFVSVIIKVILKLEFFISNYEEFSIFFMKKQKIIWFMMMRIT